MEKVVDDAIAELAPLIGVRAACRATGRPQANHYRRHRKSPKPPRPAHEVDPGQLTIHSDSGASMGSKVVAQLLADLGVTKTHSRPHVSNDNPYSEAQFKTLKYRLTFPDRFGSI